MKTIGIIGGGASGLVACIVASDLLKYDQITLYERKDRVGKKILTTGNGRCNLTNLNVTTKNYYGKNPSFVEFPINSFPPESVVSFFENLGMYCKYEHGGRVFPYSNQAATVLDVLRQNLYHKNINMVINADVSEIIKKETSFHVFADVDGQKKIFKHDQIIIACGGKSSPNLGSNGSGFSILKKLNHRIVETVPVLSQLKTDTEITKPLNGIKIDATVKAFSNNKNICETKGEVLFTNYGLSGTAILDISKVCYDHVNILLKLDLMNQYNFDEIVKLLSDRQKSLGYLTMENFLVGLFNKKVGLILAKHSGIPNLSIFAENLIKNQIINLAKTIKELEIKVHGHNGWENSQVTAGGADTDNFNEKTMESKIIPGLYAIGEVLDIFGDCGGYNLQWAWSSGYLAGKSAAKAVL